MSELRGVISAMLTPFVSTVGPVDYEWVPAYLRFLERGGIDGLVVCGTTGEGPSLGVGERERMIDLVVEQRGGMFVIAGTGCAALSETIGLSRFALERGADAVLVMPPFYFKSPTEMSVLAYFRAVCDALPTDARILLYHIPQVTAVPVTRGVIDGLLASHGRQFFGIKDSAGDIEHTRGLIKDYPQLQIYSGSDHQVANALAAGGQGVISALSSVFPDLVCAVYAAFQRGGEVAAAQERLSRAKSLIDALRTPAALKSVLAWRSELPPTYPRLPQQVFAADEAAQLRAALQEAGVA